jgi:hypothetical protein
MKYIKTFESAFLNDVYPKIYTSIKSDDVSNLKSLKFDPNYDQGFLLRICTRFNAISCLKYLVSIGADVYVSRCINLLVACGFGRIEIIQYLLSIMDRNKIHEELVKYGLDLSDKDFLIKWVMDSETLSKEKKQKVINLLESEY